MSNTPKAGHSYLMTAYYEDGARYSKAEPLFDTVLFNNDAFEGALSDDEPALLKSDSNGIIQGITPESVIKFFGGEEQTLASSCRPFVRTRSVDTSKQTSADSPLPPLKVFFPPVEAISYISMRHINGADNDATGWSNAIKKSLQTFKDSGAQPTELQQEVLPLSSLKDAYKAEVGKELSDDQKAYNEWRAKQANNKTFTAYILPKIRGLFISFTLTSFNQKLKNIIITNPTGEKLDPINADDLARNDDNTLFIASTLLDPELLISGMYEIKVVFTNNPNQSSSLKPWSRDITPITPDKDGKHYYVLKAMARFEHKVPGGEFAFINGDPITVEECLLTQFPTQYKHIIDAANDWAAKPIMAEALPAKQTTTGYASLVANIGLTKSWGELAGKVGGQESAMAASRVIGRALATQLVKPEYAFVKNALETTFAWRDVFTAKAYIELFDAIEDAVDFLNDNRGSLAKGTLANAGTEFKKYLTDFSVDDYDKTILSKTIIPEKAFALLGKGLVALDQVNNLLAVATSISGFNKAASSKASAIGDYATVIQKYLEACGFIGTEQRTLHVLFEYATANITDGFEDVEEAVELLQQNPKVKLTVEGHTCWIGSEEANLKLAQERADAIKEAIVYKGIDANRITAIGIGEGRPIADNNTEAGRVKNRRVNAIYSVPTKDGIACREGIQSCERYRTASVTALLAQLDETVKLMNACFDAALGVAALVFPPASAVAASLAIIKTAAGAYTSTVKLLDYSLKDDALSQFYLEQKMRHEAAANQLLLRDLCASEKAFGTNPPKQNIESIQYRIRSEAIHGLFNLLARASACAEDPESKSEGKDLTYYIDKYKIQAYIENFVINDGWLFPLRTADTMTMDEMWLFTVNEFNISIFDGESSKVVKQPELGNGFYLADDYRVLQIAEKAVQDRITQTKDRAKFIGGLLTTDNTMREQLIDGSMALTLFNPYMPNDVKADFQTLFPIHHLVTNDLEQLADSFQINWPHLEDDYLARCFFYRRETADDNWKFVMDWNAASGRMPNLGSTPKLTPYTQVKVILVFNDKISGIVPVNCQVQRTDGWNCEGPKYKSISRKITHSDIAELPNIRQDIVGQFGCVFHPFYQFGDIKHLGLKPMISPFWNMGGHMIVERYASSGEMKNMTYNFKISIGKNRKTEIETPEVPVSLDYSEPKDARLVVKSFLRANSISDPASPLFTNSSVASFNLVHTPFVRIGGSSGHWVTADEAFRKEIEASGAKLDSNWAGNPILKFDNFDWNKEVEFAFVLSTPILQNREYLQKSRKYYRCVGQVTLNEDRPASDFNDMDCDGPTLTQLEYEYMGKYHRSENGPALSYLAVAHDARQHPKLGMRADTPKNENELSEIINWLKNPTQHQNKIKALNNPFLNSTGYIYIAYRKMSYTNLMNKITNGLRPFGNGKINKDGSADADYYRYRFKDTQMLFSTERVDTGKGCDKQFYFKAPKTLFGSPFWDKPKASKEAVPNDSEKYKKATEWLEEKAGELISPPPVAITGQK